MKYCQGPRCHTYETKDRIRGTKGNKTYQTRRRTSFHYLGGNACNMQCQSDWFQKFGEQAVNHFGRIHEPKKLTIDNAWTKQHDQYDYNNRRWTYCIENKLLGERRPITTEQFEDESFTLNTR
jgi:hypothetical protein